MGLEVLRERVAETNRALLTTLAGLSDDQVGEASRLPGWTRGHVLAHIAGVGHAAARQLEVAVADGAPVPYYDGGMAGREAAIEAGAPASAADHVARVTAAAERMSAVAAAVTPDILDRVTGARGRSVAGVLELWWREATVHVVDLDLGLDATSWDLAFRDHLAAYLARRVRRGMALHLVADDLTEHRAIGDGPDVVTVRGAASDLVAWLAGRTAGPVRADRDGRPVDLPQLEPWP